MTKLEAKELSLEVWRYLAEHSVSKFYLPDSIYNKIKDLDNHCPLCELFYNCDCICPDCPLQRCGEGSLYDHWINSDERKINAQKIVEVIEAWEPEEEVTV